MSKTRIGKASKRHDRKLAKKKIYGTYKKKLKREIFVLFKGREKSL